MDMEKNAVALCYLSGDQVAIEAAHRYWQQRDVKKWNETVEVIAQQFGIPKKDFITYVQSAAKAYNLGSRCYWCNSPEEVTSRASYISTYSRCFTFHRTKDGRKGLCPTCQQKLDERERHAQQKALEEKNLKIRDHLRRLESISPPIGEDKLTNTDAILLLSLLLASDRTKSGNNEVGIFRQAAMIAASTSTEIQIYARLFRNGAIYPYAGNDLNEFQLDEEGKLAFDFRRIEWSLCSSLQGIPYITLREKLEERVAQSRRDPEALMTLWEYVSVAECESCLLERADHYHFFNYMIGERTVAAFNHALENFPIPKVWSMIHSSTQYAAAKKQSREINGRHAQNLVPGSIIGYADRAIKDNWTVYSRGRSNWLDESILTSLFFNRILTDYPDAFRTATSTIIRSLCAQQP